METQPGLKKTSLDIKLTLVLFLALLILKIGMANSDFYTKLSLIIFYIWFFSCLLARPKIVLSILIQKHYFALSVFLLYYFIGLVFANGLMTTLREIGAFVQYLSPIFMYEFYSRVNDKKTNKILIIIITSIYVFFSIKAISFLNIYPLAARDMISTGIRDTVMIGGGFSLAYGFSILIPLLMYYLLNLKSYEQNNIIGNKYSKLIYLFIIVLFLMVIVKSMFAISFLLLLFGCIYIVAIKLRSKKHKLVMVFLGFSLLITFFLLKDFFIQSLTSYLSSVHNVLTDKLLIVINLSDKMDTQNTGDMGIRFSLYNSSLNIWLDNFFFGIAHKYNFDAVKMMTIGLGNHSEWFDLVAKYGLIAFFLLYYIFCSKKAYLNNNGFKIALLLLFILGFLNPNHIFNIYFVTFYFVPLLGSHFSLSIKN